ncbi:HNH endonuclease [Acinetobacter sp. YH12218]|uniref:HNH endonuclease n=1 Tax=Acinetobacter sp. YH12218 TaxID=2601152 RepID=UPI0015D23529|nr:HNH endonuclease [Acinetobacter sp. YH12218]
MAKLPTLKPRLQTLKTSQPISNVTANKRNRGRSWRKLRLEVLLRDKYTCQHCGLVSISLEVDHTIPLFLGGTDAMSNLKSLCVDCHKVKTSQENTVGGGF